MRRNKTFGNHGGGHTPFHSVHFAKSGEILNELNAAICSVDIGDVPQRIRKGNADMLIRVLNGYDALLGVANAANKIVHATGGAKISASLIPAEDREALCDALRYLESFESLSDS